MKNILAILGIFALLSAYLISGDNVDQSNKDFEAWKSTFNNRFENYEDVYRLGIYLSNQKIIAEHNADTTQTYTLGENQFMAYTKEEFISLYLQTSQEVQSLEQINGPVPNAVDWRGITKVKEQKSCASGWAFASTGALEAFYYIRGGKQLIDASEQQLIDCEVYSQGCNGGNNIYPLQYISAYGLSAQTSYPYVAYQQVCKITGGQYRTNGSQNVSGSQITLQQALQNAPVSVGVDASNWQFYKSGIFNNCSSTSYNHFALASGFDNTGVWFVKNSWGYTWGETGYIRLAAGNTCAITASAYQPI